MFALQSLTAGLCFHRYLGFFGTLLLPLDVEETLDGGDVTPLVSLWEFVYWSTFVLSWVILPVLQVRNILPPTTNQSITMR